MSNNPPYLRNVNNGRLFPYDDKLAEQKNLAPYWGDGRDKVDVMPLPTPEVPEEAPEAVPVKTIKLTPEDPAMDGSTLETTHWSQLKKMVEERGGKYISRSDAIAFLQASP